MVELVLEVGGVGAEVWQQLVVELLAADAAALDEVDDVVDDDGGAGMGVAAAAVGRLLQEGVGLAVEPGDEAVRGGQVGAVPLRAALADATGHVGQALRDDPEAAGVHVAPEL